MQYSQHSDGVGMVHVVLQVMPAGATALQQAGVTRILNIAPSPRMNLVGRAVAPSNGMPDPAARTLSLVAIGQPLVGSLSSPPRQTLLMRAPSTTSPAAAPLPRKRPREPQVRPPPSEEVASLRRSCGEHRMGRVEKTRLNYADKVAEVIFLQAGGNLLNYQDWRQGPFSPQFLHLFRVHRLDPSDDDEDLTPLLKRPRLGPPASAPVPSTPAPSQPSVHGEFLILPCVPLCRNEGVRLVWCTS
ncbi:hypothetical protein PR048_026818 [Dryococelus australis]|uniref:E1A-binding protein p400 N-terminal domain-containing protein n=1 Tax=Dryococelus australis TaxID=614101 RepID=A0ABQ9GME8_9NEOP|nr:hypothetical protein PR048_026818 [Dryococelus australis]